jgi:tetratricopeptide (TPR) repeat protein/predicted Ser/Thr protein kinase
LREVSALSPEAPRARARSRTSAHARACDARGRDIEALTHLCERFSLVPDRRAPPRPLPPLLLRAPSAAATPAAPLGSPSQPDPHTSLLPPVAPAAGAPSPARPLVDAASEGSLADGATIVAEPVHTAPIDDHRGDDLLKQRLVSGTGAKVGRFTVLRHLDEGGMGLIFAARDEELDRQVALKILRTQLGEGTTGRGRLLREAQALARLSHPNVVTVYEVGEFEGQIFVAMELIEGRTLRGWLRHKKRTWREVVAVLIQAGRGLAAAHDAGIIHRDFKPSNVLVGGDGRVRVLDFGLARAPGSSGPERLVAASGGPAMSTSSTSSRLVGGALTVAGAVAGTPPYMPPEQLQGGEVDHRADIYAFCVALAEALYGERPFKGDTVADRRNELIERPIPELPRRAGVPAFLRAAVLRGLAPDPARRFQSMHELLAAIDRDPARTLGKVAVGGALGLLLLAVGVLVARPSAACTELGGELGEIWSDDRRAALGAAITGTGLNYAEATWERLRPRLDAHASAWIAAREGACVAHQRGEHSAELYGLQLACLQRHRSAFKALIDTFSAADTQTVERAIQAVGDLPAAAACADIAALTAAVAPPEDPQIAAEIASLRDQLDPARVALSLRKSADGLAVAEPILDRARDLNDPAFAAEVAALVGELENDAGELEAAEARLTDAVWLSDQVHDDDRLALAMSNLIFVTGERRGRHDEALRWRRHADTVRARLPAGAPGRPRLLWAIGTVLYRRSQLDEASELLGQALALSEQIYGLEDQRIGMYLSGLGNVHMLKGDAAAAIAGYTRALAIEEAAFGPEHPRIAGTLVNLGAAAGLAGDLDAAIQHLQRALKIEEAALGPEHADLASTLVNIGVTYSYRGDDAAARPYFERALAIEAGARGEDHPEIAHTHDNLCTLLEELGEPAAARHHCERSLAIRRKALTADDPHLARSLDLLGRLELKQGDPRSALPRLEQALTIYEARGDIVEPRQLAEGRHVVVAALHALGRQPDRQRQLGAAALATLRAEDDDKARAMVAELEAWLREAPRAAPAGEQTWLEKRAKKRAQKKAQKKVQKK